MLKFTVSEQEAILLQDIENVAFGEVFDVENCDAKPTRVLTVDDKAFNFIKNLRSIGTFAKVTVHDGLPSGAEYMSKTPSGLKCLRKIRF